MKLNNEYIDILSSQDTENLTFTQFPFKCTCTFTDWYVAIDYTGAIVFTIYIGAWSHWKKQKKRKHTTQACIYSS